MVSTNAARRGEIWLVTLVASRLVRRLGSVEPIAMEQIETALTLILGLDRRATAR